jgi:hypothetical protein
VAPVGIALLIVLLIAAAIAFWVVASRRSPSRSPNRAQVLPANGEWTNDAGGEFTGLSEAARCDLVFAVAALDEDRSQRILERALRDPSEAVALAAARALVNAQRGAIVQRYLADDSGERARRIAQILDLLESD